MADPFVYTPHPSYMLTQYLDPAYGHNQASPFIPSASLYPTSPYTNTNENLPPAPGTPNTPRRVHFGDDFNLDPYYTRQRRPSWTAPPPHTSPAMSSVAFPGSTTPFIPPSPFLGPQPMDYYQRRHSFGAQGQAQPTWASPGPAWSPYRTPTTPLYQTSPWQQPVQPPVQPVIFQLHPWLNGECPRPDFIFDISSPTFNPLRLVAPGQSAPISWEDLRQPATHPPITKLTITCDRIPQWPILLEFNPHFGMGRHGEHLPPHAAPPISIYDILMGVYQTLNQRVSHIDWAKLSMSEEKAISRAYAHRCRRGGTTEMIERANGVKRVDFLLDKVFFKGLVRDGEGWDKMKLIVA
ncbi:hypothetical protein ONZ45_g7085 [Pleurotus djamor]|nr:hypothetical protein ONZ45_g7085 [Pleurotus djamor]